MNWGQRPKDWEPRFIRGGTLTARASTFARNTAFAASSRYAAILDQKGGAIYALGKSEFLACAFQDNQAGGGNSFEAGGGHLTPGGTAFGGAIFAETDLLVRNCTFFSNKAMGGNGNPFPSSTYPETPGGNGEGGAIYSNGGRLDVSFCTFANNQAIAGKTTDGFAYGNSISGKSTAGIFLDSSIFSNDTPTPIRSLRGNITDLGFNLSSDAPPGLTAPTTLKSTDPKLGTYGAYGGPTPTMPLLFGSPALDAGSTTTFPPADQRGHSRPSGTGADIGAFEQSPNQIVMLRGSDDDYVISFFGDPNRVATLETSVDLSVWSMIPTEQPSPGAVQSTPLFDSREPARFFRVRSAAP